MVLRTLVVSLALAGCGQSLFDNNLGGGSATDGGMGTSDGDMTVPSSCPSPCLADAAADFPDGDGVWRFVEDRRDRTWTPMTASGQGRTGADGNSIRACDSSVAACTELPGALLVTTAGAQAASDPALEYTVATTGVVQLTVRVHLPAGSPLHQVRVYRNSREDSLITANATAGATFERAFALDALAGDRLLVALVPTAEGAADIPVHVYVNDTGMNFPQQCQLAVGFAAAMGNNVANACGTAVNYREWDSTNQMSIQVAPELAAAPFPELGMAADIPLPRYYLGADVLVRAADTTTQLWVRHDAFDGSYAATVFSDLDLDAPFGGLQIGLFDASGTPMIEAATCTGQTGNILDMVFTNAEFPSDGGWHFVRVVHTNGQVKMCVDGVRIGSYALPAGEMQSAYEPRFGRNVVWLPTGAFFDGGVDDVRVFTTALPCD